MKDVLSFITLLKSCPLFLYFLFSLFCFLTQDSSFLSFIPFILTASLLLLSHTLIPIFYPFFFLFFFLLLPFLISFFIFFFISFPHFFLPSFFLSFLPSFICPSLPSSFLSLFLSFFLASFLPFSFLSFPSQCLPFSLSTFSFCRFHI